MERERFLQRRQQLEQQHAAQVSAGRALSAARERGLRVERDRQDSQEAEREVTRLVRRNGPRHPPPPLPLPLPLPDQPGDDASVRVPSPAPVSATIAVNGVSASTAPAPAPSGPVTPAVVTCATTTCVTSSTATCTTPATSVRDVIKSLTSAAATNGSTGTPAVVNFQARLKPVPPPAPPSQVQVQVQGPGAPAGRRSPAPPPPPTPTPTPSPGPPHCPTPDYDSDSSGSLMVTTSTSKTATITTTTMANGKVSASDASKCTKVMLNGNVNGHVQPEVEMQSLDSMELLEPRAKEPRPPQTYFKQHSKSAVAGRPSVCVTIREYGNSNANSRQPSKFTFLNSNNRSQVDGQPGQQQQQQQQEPPACRLQSELATTLSRSNLRSRTEVPIPEPVNGEGAPKVSDGSSRSVVTITSVNGTAPSAKGGQPNGILKKVAAAHLASNGLPVGHGITPAALAGAGAALNRTKAVGFPAKSISFGAKATIINEKTAAS